MIDGVFVVDATVHGSNFQAKNMVHPAMPNFIRALYHWGSDALHPQDDPRYKISSDQFHNMFRYQPDLLAEMLFGESDVDVALYQSVPLYGLFVDGSSPLWVADEIKKRYPHRIFTYGDVTPYQPDLIAHIDKLVDVHKVLGLKLYPLDIATGETRPVRFDDEEKVFPLIEHARRRGLKVIAVHKAVPLGPTSIAAYDLEDMAPAVSAFPDMTFEIVHGGMAFTRETAALLGKYENVTVNLEASPCYALNFADRFADMMAPLLATGAHERIFFSTGTPIMHPQPFVEAFWRFEMPRGYPPLTWEMKRGILGANFAKFHDWDIADLQRRCAEDPFGRQSEKSEPYAALRRMDSAYHEELTEGRQ
jgi:predicted TIM-barrel fold metal-dependent hydrolase